MKKNILLFGLSCCIMGNAFAYQGSYLTIINKTGEVVHMQDTGHTCMNQSANYHYYIKNNETYKFYIEANGSGGMLVSTF